ncbi:SRPBCC family protein [Streptomyces fumanus]|uniref:Shy6-polyketide cyclase n=1 Tax=Streptomyces fumanus TaxID=67302 RepID=A0A919AZF9_9ACTN|nr:SRPBCC family protein [Streptomyces fumanus]GHF34424.1 hypothetical protein GCM10018772_70090 [Streptomyces fumanus]
MKDIDRSAPVIVEHRVVIAATPETLWDLHTGINNWTDWNPGIDKAHLEGDFAEGNTFHWETAGLTIASTIAEVQPRRRTVWGGPAHGIDGVHIWSFEPHPEGTLVTTTESWAGAPVEADPAGMRAALEGSLLAWLDALREAAEGSRG